MNLRTKTSVYGLAGLVIAGLAIIAGSLSGAFTIPGSFNGGVLGSLSIMLTDPPSVPPGVTAVDVTYTNVGVHATGLGDLAWIWTGDKGTVDTMGLINISQTVSAGQVPIGRYNAIAFQISAAEITFNGVSYNATVDNGRLVVPIPGGLVVNSTVPTAAVVDISPVVINLGTTTSPDFVITTAGQALQVPRGEFSDGMRQIGFRLPLEGRHWFRAFVIAHSGNVSETSVSLGPNSLSVSITNTSPNDAAVKLIIASPTPGNGTMRGPLATLANSFVFVVQPNGTLELISFPTVVPGIVHQIKSEMQTSGFPMNPGASNTFTYSGTITSLLTDVGVTNGSTYYVTVVGPGILSFSHVVAT